MYLGHQGYLKWDGNWVTFIDTMLQMSILAQKDRSFKLPQRLRSFRVDPIKHLEHLSASFEKPDSGKLTKANMLP